MERTINFSFDTEKAMFHLALDVKSKDLDELLTFCKICRYDGTFCSCCAVDAVLTDIATEIEKARLAAA